MTNSSTVHINGTAVQHTRLQFSLSQTTLATRAGFSQAVLRSIERNHLVDSAIPARLLVNLATILHLPLHRLLDDCDGGSPCPRRETNQQPTPPGAGADADLLAAVLNDLHVPISKTTLAFSLNWTLPRVTAAIHSLNATLHGTPLTVRCDDTGTVMLTPRSPADNTTASRLASHRTATALPEPAARLAYRALRRDLRPQDVAHDAQPHLGFLRRAGIVEDALDRDTVVLTPIARAAFPDLDDEHRGIPHRADTDTTTPLSGGNRRPIRTTGLRAPSSPPRTVPGAQ
jgi:transcriptional regulator with XRE-family HTH domain